MSIFALSMAALPCCAEEDVEAGSAALRVDWPVYPRRAEHNTVAEGGNRRWAETARQNAVPIALAEADQRPPGRGRCGGRAGGCRKNAVLRVRVRHGFPGRGVEIGRSLCASARGRALITAKCVSSADRPAS